MAIAFDWLNDANLTIGASAETIYSNPTLTITTLSEIWMYNSHSSAVTVTLYLVPDSNGSAGAAATTNAFFSESIAAGDEVSLKPQFVLGDLADTLQAVADVADKVNIFVFGAKKT